MYVGIGTERGKRVLDEDAFDYTMGEIRKDPELFEEYKKSMVEWFFSGDWIYKEETENGNVCDMS